MDKHGKINCDRSIESLTLKDGSV